MKSGAEYLEELKKLHPVIYFRGERITDILGHPVLQPVINAAMATYDLALDPAKPAGCSPPRCSPEKNAICWVPSGVQRKI
ncbi:MAG: 4-hydroxyphenylacetate 3-hydroxylase N-terminal domain-containing protein [Bacillota bacterium]